MASLNTSTNGPSISKSYQAVVNAPAPSGAAASSPTYGQWAIFSVSAPLANAFQQDSANKESVLKVQSTGEGELIDLVDEFSDGRIQFAFVKVKDSNTGLPKCALIAWCGEGVPERTKGYFTSHMNTAAKLFHGYHVQITARSDRDLTPEGIIQKVADASGSKYSSSSSAPPPVAASTKPSVASKPVFTPTQSSGVSGGYNPIGRTAPKRETNVDEDGWGADAPPVVRTQLEKVQPAYQPTKVNMRELTSQPTPPTVSSSQGDDRPDVVKGAYQPVGKVDIAAIRRQAQESGQLRDDRPTIVKGSYEPVGKVDIAAIRAKAQKPEDSLDYSRPAPVSASSTGPAEEPERPRSLAERSAAFSQGPERLTSLPKPKVANKFGGGSTFTGTKAPVPGGFEAKPVAPAAPVGAASRTFADQGGKTPAQLWAEKKARERGLSGSGEPPLSPSGYSGQSPIVSQKSGDGGWKSSYTGKSWAPVQTTHTGRSSIGQQVTGGSVSREQEEEVPTSPSGGFGSLRDRFSGAPPMGAPASFDRAPPPAPEPDTSNKPNRGIPIPGLSMPQNEPEEESAPALPTPPPQPRSPTPPTPDMREASPIRVAVPVSASAAPAEVADVHDEQLSPPPAMPAASMARAIPTPAAEDDEPAREPDFGRAAAQAEAAATLGQEAVEAAPAAVPGGERARAEYDYEAAEDNEVSLREGELVSDIQRIDPDWWLVKNEAGQTGLVPSNYLTMLEEDEPAAAAPPSAATPAAAPAAPAAPQPAASHGATATALYDYEAGEDNELSFPENAVITNVTFPDEDWWHGEYNGESGLFPANYTKLDE
ncbi:actin binding protein [Knufia peltigerae]|uniref:Actin binding protein n=1 Tax=Knufia peltigerae TaxID=1002370 RepID=A0AA38YFT1_9EURO|nr:actin binding protein [Knufia peltigerae]